MKNDKTKLSDFIIDSNGIKFSLQQLNKLDSSDPKLRDLKCKKCGCKLRFSHSSYKKDNPSISTWPYKKHIYPCSFSIRKKSQESVKKNRILNEKLSDSELRKKQKYMLDKISGKNKKSNGELRDTSKNKDKKDKENKDKENKKDSSVTYGGVKGSNTNSNSKYKRMIYRENNIITVNDAGKTITVGGSLLNIEFNNKNKSALIFIKSKNGKKLTVHTSPNYFNEIIGTQKRLLSLSRLIKKAIIKPLSIITVYITINKKNLPECWLYEEKDIVLSTNETSLSSIPLYISTFKSINYSVKTKVQPKKKLIK